MDVALAIDVSHQGARHTQPLVRLEGCQQRLDRSRQRICVVIEHQEVLALTRSSGDVATGNGDVALGLDQPDIFVARANRLRCPVRGAAVHDDDLVDRQAPEVVEHVTQGVASVVGKDRSRHPHMSRTLTEAEVVGSSGRNC
jgi:hypothetical protein